MKGSQSALIFLGMSVFLLSGCGYLRYYLGIQEETLEGERKMLFPPDDGDGTIKKEAKTVVVLAPSTTKSWPQLHDNAHALPPHGKLTYPLEEQWRVSVDDVADEGVNTSPVVAFGRLFYLSTTNHLIAIDTHTGKTLWSRSLVPFHEGEGDAIGGGVAYHDGFVYVATGYRRIQAFRAVDGKPLWTFEAEAPFRSAPTVFEGKVYAFTTNSYLYALEIKTGRVLWTHRGLAQTENFLVQRSVSVDSRLAVVSYGSSQIYALLPDSGLVLWNNLVSTTSGIIGENSFHASTSPVIVEDMVIVADGQSVTAFTVKEGKILWSLPLETLYKPFINGSFLFLVSHDGYLIAVDRRNGAVIWRVSLDAEGGLWGGAFLAGERLVVFSDRGWIQTHSLQSGERLSRLILSSVFATYPISTMPILVEDTLFVLTDSGLLISYR